MKLFNKTSNITASVDLVEEVEGMLQVEAAYAAVDAVAAAGAEAEDAGAGVGVEAHNPGLPPRAGKAGPTRAGPEVGPSRAHDPGRKHALGHANAVPCHAGDPLPDHALNCVE